MPVLRTETKRRARALQILYAWETTGKRPVRGLASGLARLTGPEPMLLDNAEALAQGVIDRLTDLDRLCGEASDHWRLDRLGVIERNILRLGAYELQTATVAPRVAIDEALFLAHRFGGPQAPPFINGVLDRVARTLGRL